MEKEVMQVKLFNTFEMHYKGVTLHSDNIKSDMIEALLIYMILYHHKENTTQEICERLWDEEESDNPAGALKNLMYRLRTILKKVWEDDFILTGRGSYRWNEEIKLQIDTEYFEETMRKFDHGKVKNEQALLEELIQMYSISYLNKFSGQHWILQLISYYQSQFMSAVKKLSKFYLYSEDYEALERLSICALESDKYDESLHYLLMFSYRKQNKQNLAITHYQATKKMLYDELGISFSKEVQDLYTSLLNKENNMEMDINIIQHDLDEALNPQGAFLCEYGVFREIYRLQARQAQRLGMSIYCALFSAKVLLKIPPESDSYKRIINKTMDTLQEMIVRTLRVGDTLARYSLSQFVILLPTCTYETAVYVMERLVKKYEAIDSSGKIELTFDVCELSKTEGEKV